MRIAYFDCFSGAAGDMIVGAALDAGASQEHLRTELAKLGLHEVELQIETVVKNGIAATSFNPHITKQQHHHRHLPAIIEIINSASLSSSVQEQAIAIFRRLAQAEAKVHRISEDQVHFHEVGAADAIIDIVGACLALESLNVQKVYCSTLTVGSGTVKCAHGVLPVPAPATAELIKGLDIRPGPVESELLTPTGAAILTTIATNYGPVPAMHLEAIGHGAGQRDYPAAANILRLLVGQTTHNEMTNATTDQVTLLEANIDDATGELIGHITEQLLTEGALDVTCTSIMMKKNRPGTQISVMCSPDRANHLERILFSESTTLGIRRSTCDRTILPREHRTVETPFGPIRVKLGFLDDQTVTSSPEFEDCRQAAHRHNVPVKKVVQAAMNAWNKPG